MPENTANKTDVPKPKAYCIFCGSTIGDKSDRTGGLVTAIYDCPTCQRNYCNECSYEDAGVQRCLRCDSLMEKVM